MFEKLQQAIISFISTQAIIFREENELKMIFMMIDKGGNGMLTQEELLNGYRKFYKLNERAIVEVKYLMVNGSANNCGAVKYNEFLTAMRNTKQADAKKMLQKSFDLYNSVCTLNIIGYIWLNIIRSKNIG